MRKIAGIAHAHLAAGATGGESMRDDEQRELVGAIRGTARPLTGAMSDYDPIIALARDRRFVLIGEASHGTHEFYRTRALITRRLIEELGFTAVAAEADWPDAYRVNQWVRGEGNDRDAAQALGGFRRFPQWMWRNTEVVDFVAWLRAHDARARDPSRQAGFYGLDLYSLHASIEAVLAYLREVDPDAARRAAYRYGCFDHFGDDPQAYGYAAAFDLSESCEAEAVNQLVELRAAAAKYVRRDGSASADALFFAEQNARVVRNAEEYYRAMFRGRHASWNLRDRHMKETLDELVGHLDTRGVPARVVVWAHNSHLGDARATDMGLAGELNVGQLVRESHGDDALLVGFTTFAGTVTAARDWDEPAGTPARPSARCRSSC
jgi:erythromycin esterase-like protein